MAERSRLATAEPTETADAVVVLRSTWSGAVLGKAYAPGANGGLAESGGYRAGKFFSAESVPVGNIRDLHAAWERIAGQGGAVLVRGDLTGARAASGPCPGLITRRTAAFNKDGHPAGLRDVARHWLLLDMDDVPNLPDIDPRTDPRAALDFLLGLLPRAVRRAAVSWNWSSSMCVGTPEGQAPATLSAHLRIWLDAPLAHLAARRLLERLAAHATARLRVGGGEPTGAAPDWKVAEPQQPLYVAAPRFGGGLRDPFPGGSRRGLREGAGDVVVLADLEAELDAAGASARPAAGRKPASRKAGAATVPSRRGSAEVVSLAAARALATAKKGGGRTGAHMNSGRTREIFAARAPQEIVRLVRGRVAAGATDPRWRAWHEASGVPEGRRDVLLFLTGCLVAEAMPKADLTVGKVDAAVLGIGRLLMSADWIREEWAKGGYAADLVGRAEAAGQGRTETWGGRLKDPRYRVGKARLLKEFGVLPEEVFMYGLSSLATERDRLAAVRRASGAVSRAETQAANAKKVRKAKKLMASGSSKRAAASAVGMDEKQLRRTLAEEVRAASVPIAECGQNVRLVEAKARKEEGKPRVRSISDQSEIAPSDPEEESYAVLVASARSRGADGRGEVPEPSPGASAAVLEAHLDALEAVADARRRGEARLRRLRGPAAEARAWYDGLVGLSVAEALARIGDRRRELARSHGSDQGGGTPCRAAELRRIGRWALENRHARRILGPAWVRRGGAEDAADVPRIPGASAAWRAAVRDAEGLALLSDGERQVVVSARAAAAEDAADREDVRLLRQALQAVLGRRLRTGPALAQAA